MTDSDMNAVVVAQPGGPGTLRRVAIPAPKHGQVLVRVAASPINPSDLAYIAGSYATRPAFPAIPGFEGSGTVVAAGDGLLPRLLKGRRVAFASAAGGAWAEYIALPAARCIPVGHALSLEQAATLLVNPLTALAFFEIARQGRHAAIVSDAAASALGRMIIRLARVSRVPLINIVRRPEQAAELRGIGAEHVLVDSEEGFESRLKDLAHRLSATLVLDPVGGIRTQVLVNAAPPKSTIVAYALLSGDASAFNARRLIADDKRIEGFYLGHWIAQRSLWGRVKDVRRLRSLGKTTLQTHVQARFPLAAVEQAIATYRSNMTAGKVLFVADLAASSGGRSAAPPKDRAD